MSGRSLWDGCRKAVYGLLFALVIPMSAYIFYGALDMLDGAGTLQGMLHGKLVVAFLSGVSLLLCLLLAGLFRNMVSGMERRRNVWAVLLFGGMLALQVLMVLLVRTSLRQDHLKIFDTAAALLDGGTVAETHYRFYFMKYPNNLPICLFTLFWLKPASALGIPKEYWMDLMKLVNVAFMNAGLFCAFRLACRYRSERTGLFLLLMTAVNPLWYLLGQMYYTSTISLAFSMGAFWLCSLAWEQEDVRKKYALYACVGILLALGFRIRATVILTVLSLAVCAALCMKRLPGRREALSVLAALLGAVLVLSAYGQAEKRYAGFDPSVTGYPAVHWIMMSAQGEGQYNSADDAYTGSFSTREERTAADFALLRERVEEMGPAGLFTLFRNKLRIAFSDGTDDYDSLFFTMQETSGIQKYISGGREDLLAVYAHGYHGMLTGLVLLALILRMLRRRADVLDVSAFNLCGAYLFYLLWEVDNAYSIPFMLLLLLWAADGMEQAADWMAARSGAYPAMRFLPAVSAAGLFLALLGTAAAVRGSGAPVREYAVLQDQESSRDLTLQTEFSQTFRTARSFDHVDLWVANWDGPANDSVYEVRILDEEGAVAASGEIIGASAPCMEACTVAFEKIVPGREREYRIQIRLKNPDCTFRTDFLYYQSGAWDMYRGGALFAPEEIPETDLAFSVYEELP